FRFQVRTDEFHIPADRSVYSLPREVEKELRRFGPTGRFQAEATIQRRRSGTSIDYDGKLFVRGANIRYARFAYPLVDVQGEIRFTNELLDVVKLDGHGPHGGRVVVTGSIAPPGDGAAVELHITGTDLPVD